MSVSQPLVFVCELQKRKRLISLYQKEKDWRFLLYIHYHMYIATVKHFFQKNAKKSSQDYHKSHEICFVNQYIQYGPEHTKHQMEIHYFYSMYNLQDHFFQLQMQAIFYKLRYPT